MTVAPASPLLRHGGIALPLLGGPMYPCSNPELVGAVSRAGALGIVQPIALTYVHGHEFRAGIRYTQRLAEGRPIGMNALIEASSRAYRQRMVRWVEIALEEGVRFFLTSLGNPRWVVDRVHAAGGVVYHDVTERKWALKGRDAGVDGLIAVNDEAGGHTGSRMPHVLYEEIADLGLPLVAAGGVATPAQFRAMLDIGYAGVQIGTRLIATMECSSDPAYKQAIVAATAADIVLTQRVSGVPLAVIRTPAIERLGTDVGPIARRLFRGRRTKKWIRLWYGLRALRRLKQSSIDGTRQDYWPAGRSVDAIHDIPTVEALVHAFTTA